jgi:hypothetical protein
MMLRRIFYTVLAFISAPISLYYGATVQNFICHYSEKHNISWGKCYSGCGLDCGGDTKTAIGLSLVVFFPPVLFGILGFVLSAPQRKISRYWLVILSLSLLYLLFIGAGPILGNLSRS